jgi:hypothetical protein
MKPFQFWRANKILMPPKGGGVNSQDIAYLPVWTDGTQCVSCWRLTWRERLSVLFFGRVWLAVLSGGTQPPVALQGCREYLTGGNPLLPTAALTAPPHSQAETLLAMRLPPSDEEGDVCSLGDPSLDQLATGGGLLPAIDEEGFARGRR